ncbi:MAG: RluA family pseudouridine synthase [Erysipelotrichaceae bacterium]|nr:RluA family pseudouridine synthase [Erysipelotrichaceae bacterium]MBQ7889614.1 RluA family pseudouridine synthase [Erysipelotrichaceae bacterium]
MNPIQLVITEEMAAKRLDKVLCEALEDLSRNYLQTLMDEKRITVNGKAAKASTKCKVNDVVEITLKEAEEIEAVPQNLHLDVVYEDSDVIVINKPKGMVVHPGPGNPDGTLVNGLLYHCKDLSGINGVLRPGIVHRIDKDTTGLIIACKNDKSHESLAEQLMMKTASRKYMALVHGVMPHEFGTIDAPIGRDEKDRQKMAVTAKNSKNAVTHFRVLERFHDMTLMECSLETGRTHQIRVHLQYIGYPIVGDPKYSLRKTRTDTQGQMLHAFELTFVHPSTQKTMTLNAPLPEYYETILKELREKGDVK